MFDLYQFELGVEGCYANAWGEKHLRNRLRDLITYIKETKIKFLNEYSSKIIENLVKPGKSNKFGMDESIQDALSLLNTFTDEFLEWRIENGRLLLVVIEEPNKELKDRDYDKPREITIQVELLFFEQEEIEKILSRGEALVENVWTLHNSECRGPDYIKKGIHIVNVLGYCLMPEQINLPEDPLEPEDDSNQDDEDD